jgi:hypothetical protein
VSLGIIAATFPLLARITGEPGHAPPRRPHQPTTSTSFPRT